MPFREARKRTKCLTDQSRHNTANSIREVAIGSNVFGNRTKNIRLARTIWPSYYRHHISVNASPAKFKLPLADTHTLNSNHHAPYKKRYKTN